MEHRMKPVENQTLLKQLNWRYATEKFDPTRKISHDDWNTLEQALIATASSFGLQPWHFVVITSQKLKDELVAASFGQQQIADASHVVVFAVKKGIDAEHVRKYLQRISEVRGVPVEQLEGFKKALLKTIARHDSKALDEWSSKQVYIALGNLLTSAAMLGIDTCPMEGINVPRYDAILGLDQRGYGTLMIATLGYRDPSDSAATDIKVRFKADDVVTHLD